MLQKISIDGVLLTLATADTHESHWIDYNDYLRQLEAAWLRLSDDELPLNPRIGGALSDPQVGLNHELLDTTMSPNHVTAVRPHSQSEAYGFCSRQAAAASPAAIRLYTHHPAFDLHPR